MKRKQARAWMALMLSGFILRSLIPVGFMPMVGPGHGIQLVICDSYAPVPWAISVGPMDMSVPMDAGMDMNRHDHRAGAANSGENPPVHYDRGSCQFGCSPALGILAGIAKSPIAVLIQPTRLAVNSPQVVHFEVSRRAQSPRGPPA